MSLELRSHDPGRASERDKAAPSSGKSPVPHIAHTPPEAGQSGTTDSPHQERGATPECKAHDTGASGLLLDFRADREEDSLCLLALAAVSALGEGAGYALDAAVSLARRGRTPVTSGNSERAIGLARWDQGNGDGPVSQALSGRLAIIHNDLSKDARWPGYWRQLRDASYRSIVSVPLSLEPGCSAALTLLTDKTNAFTPAALADIEAFGKVAASSYLMATEFRDALAAADHLRAAMERRTSIDVACGVIMGQNRCSYKDAFNILATASSHRNIKVRVLAESLLEDLPEGTPATHFNDRSGSHH